MVREVNEQLKQGALSKGWGFLDIYAATVGDDGRSNEKWHLDGWHLQPAFYARAKDWLIIPA